MANSWQLARHADYLVFRSQSGEIQLVVHREAITALEPLADAREETRIHLHGGSFLHAAVGADALFAAMTDCRASLSWPSDELFPPDTGSPRDAAQPASSHSNEPRDLADMARETLAMLAEAGRMGAQEAAEGPDPVRALLRWALAENPDLGNLRAGRMEPMADDIAMEELSTRMGTARVLRRIVAALDETDATESMLAASLQPRNPVDRVDWIRGLWSYAVARELPSDD